MKSRLGWALALVGLAAFLAAAAGLGVRSSHQARLTGDEPHYLLTALSLAEDRDLNVADEYVAGRYRPFHEVALRPQARPLEGGALVEPHGPLLPLILAIPASLGGWAAAKLTLAALAGILAATVLWVAVRRFGAPLAASVTVVLVFALSAPLAVYGTQVYPEIPAALALAVALGALTGPLRGGGVATLGAAVVALPWLSVKYVPIAAALALLSVVRLLRRGRRREAVGLAGMLALAGAGFVAGHQAWYGGWTPYAAGSHFAEAGELSVMGTDPNLWGRSLRLLGLMVDRTFGLAAWQPAWLLLLPAGAALVARRPPGWDAPVVLLGADWLSATFLALTMHGWWWPGRQVVAVLPAGMVALAWWAGRGFRRPLLVAGAGAPGIFTYAWVVREGWVGGLTWAVDFFETSNPWYRAWRLLLPDYWSVSALTWALHTLWIGLAAALFLWGARRRPPPPEGDGFGVDFVPTSR
jgi:hypothetical protein